mmetsp:Transcript_34337/g.79415  ORF Transcript_34337/g.79415 Transcript_34337/m.79415 type:complete len:480 (-) Transcript_34337:439-1878(-)
MDVTSSPIHVEVHAPICAAAAEMLTPDSLRFVGHLCHKFDDRRLALLLRRSSRALEFDGGGLPTYPSETLNVRSDPSWTCAPPPPDLADRRVEITGPTDRKMVINGLNSGARAYMADFEDSSAPTWSNLTEGQRNLRDAVRGTITYTNRANGKVYAPRSDGKLAVLMVRPRGWHLEERHVTVNGRVASGSLFDFGLYFYHNVHELLKKGSGPYFYLPKIEGYLEARLWNDVFIAAEKYFGLPKGTIRATILLETITAAFEMEEILYEIKDHSLGLNCGRWDYLFSYIKKLRCHADKIMPDRSHLTMDVPFLQAYVQRLIYICHKRGTFAMGGMAATIPIKHDPKANARAMESIRQDKVREVMAGHDGTWVAHPALVQTAVDIFDEHMRSPNQIHFLPNAGSDVTEAQLIEVPIVAQGHAITSSFLREGISIILAYTEAWLRGVGCIPLHHKMEDAATAEISRAQIWQWQRHNAVTQEDQ